MLIISYLIYVLFSSILNKNSISKFTLKIDKNFKKNDRGLFSYDKIESYLKSMGLEEVFGREIAPTEFIMTKVILSLLLFTGFLKEGVIFGILFGILAFFLPDILIRISNSSDNEDMLPDLKRVYDTLRIQTKAGVFFTTSLTECYLVVKNKRLKKALLEMNNIILTKNDIDEAIEGFNSKFENQYIDTFCIVIKQSIESGKMVQILQDLSSQIEDIQEAINIKLAEKVKSKLQLLQFLIYIGVTAIIVFGVFSEITSGITGF